jgi:transcriptional regulator with XRE-family HTH domain
MALGDKLRTLRLQKNLSQMEVSAKLGYDNNSYVSDVELNRFVPATDKLRKWVAILGLPEEKADDLITEAKLEELGITEPAFTMMLKDVPDMTTEEKQSIIMAYEAVVQARGQKRKHRSKQSYE